MAQARCPNPSCGSIAIEQVALNWLRCRACNQAFASFDTPMPNVSVTPRPTPNPPPQSVQQAARERAIALCNELGLARRALPLYSNAADDNLTIIEAALLAERAAGEASMRERAARLAELPSGCEMLVICDLDTCDEIARLIRTLPTGGAPDAEG